MNVADLTSPPVVTPSDDDNENPTTPSKLYYIIINIIIWCVLVCVCVRACVCMRVSMCLCTILNDYIIGVYYIDNRAGSIGGGTRITLVGRGMLPVHSQDKFHDQVIYSCSVHEYWQNPLTNSLSFFATKVLSFLM